LAGNPEKAEKTEKNEGLVEAADDTIGGSTTVPRRHMPPKPSRSAGRTGRTDPPRPDQPGSDPLDLAERLFGPDPSHDAHLRSGDGEEGLRVRSKPLWVRLLGFELPWRRRKRLS
jgi:hypothetical protein